MFNSIITQSENEPQETMQPLIDLNKKLLRFSMKKNLAA